MAIFDGDYGFWPAGHDVERERMAAMQQQQLGGLGVFQNQQLAGLAGQQQGSLQGLGLGPGFIGQYASDVKKALATAIAPAPPFPWSRIWFYVWRLGSGLAYAAAVWWFCMAVK